MKNLLLIVAALFFLGLQTNAQEKYFTREGFAKFFSEAPMENITAENHQVTAVLDLETGRMEFAILMKSFEFEKALMEEHFNENYVESDTHPKSTFKGAIQNFSEAVDFATDGVYEVVMEGELNIHGVTQNIEAPASFTIAEGAIAGHSVFSVNCEDYDIKIPSVVQDNIASIIEVTIDVNLLPFE